MEYVAKGDAPLCDINITSAAADTIYNCNIIISTIYVYQPMDYPPPSLPCWSFLDSMLIRRFPAGSFSSFFLMLCFSHFLSIQL